MEIKKRCELLMRMIRKEFEEHQNQPANTTTMSDTHNLKPRAIGKRRATTHSIENGGAKKANTNQD